jgi:hypothetical protein
MTFKEIKYVCPWSKDYNTWGGGDYSLCEPVEFGRRGNFKHCKPGNCPLWAIEKARELCKR